jgi:hypothetical protein
MNEEALAHKIAEITNPKDQVERPIEEIRRILLLHLGNAGPSAAW